MTAAAVWLYIRGRVDSGPNGINGYQNFSIFL